MTREDFLVAYNIGHRDGEVNAYCPNDYNDIFDIKQQPNEDCISRKVVLEGLKSIAKAKSKSDAQKSLMGRVMFFAEHLPSVTPQPKEHTEERTETHECDLEQIIKSTIKEYIDKDCDDVIEMLLTLNKDLCEHIRKERINERTCKNKAENTGKN